MAKKSKTYKLSKWLFTKVIKLCESMGHKWQSYGTVKTCKRCGTTRKAPENYYFDGKGVQQPCSSFFNKKFHNCETYGHVMNASGQCVECGVIR